jgi:predicted DNA binding CopG/RHH family protein
METLMAQSVHNQLAQFRVNDVLLRAAREKASRDGMTFSELTRAALRRELAA